MTLTKRIIACLDVKNGRTVKGVQFEAIRDMGDPVELACYYAEEGIDELVFLDITATNERRKTFPELVKAVAKNLKLAEARGMSTLLLRLIGLPVSTVSARASSSRFSSIRSAILFSILNFCSAGITDHSANAALAF